MIVLLKPLCFFQLLLNPVATGLLSVVNTFIPNRFSREVFMSRITADSGKGSALHASYENDHRIVLLNNAINRHTKLIFPVFILKSVSDRVKILSELQLKVDHVLSSCTAHAPFHFFLGKFHPLFRTLTSCFRQLFQQVRTYSVRSLSRYIQIHHRRLR